MKFASGRRDSYNRRDAPGKRTLATDPPGRDFRDRGRFNTGGLSKTDTAGRAGGRHMLRRARNSASTSNAPDGFVERRT